jgi:hypothetical protein
MLKVGLGFVYLILFCGDFIDINLGWFRPCDFRSARDNVLWCIPQVQIVSWVAVAKISELSK